jgi:phosphoribosylamine--glycine ligase
VSLLNVLLIGSGGREHALAWKLKQSPRLGNFYVAPGSDAMRALGTHLPVNVDDHAALVKACKEHAVDLVVVGPEGPLVAGVADALRKAGMAVFGPGKLAAQLEGSKDYSKQFMFRHGVATAKARSFDNRPNAIEYALTLGFPVVVKADGLAAGKGVSICEDHASLEKALADCFEAKVFGDAGSHVLIEEFMAGEEASLLCFSDGKVLRPMASAQDHKRVGEGDTGPNTGGMGVYSPAPVLSEAELNRVWERVLAPTLAGLHAEGLDFRGCLYVGLMIDAKGPRVVEYNARFGDPETQAIVPRMDFDLLEVMLACAEGRLADLPPLQWKPGASASVVWASRGYPASAEKGRVIEGLEQAEATPGAVVFHAGTARKDGAWATNGGRVVAVTATGADLASALKTVYTAGAHVRFDGMHFRRDIGYRALARG